MGFLLPAVLAGVLAVAWPIYLHVRKRQRRIQVVPSLRLFGYARKQLRRFRLQQVLLLLARVLVLIALVLLLGQPYLETAWPLPLPVAADEDERLFLGVLVDESLTAQHGAGAQNRLRQATAWLVRELANLPPTTEVRVAACSAPVAGRPLTVPEALALLPGLKPIPQPGNATEALAELVRSTETATRGCLIVAASRDAALWPAPEPGTATAACQVLFFDTTDWQCPAVISSVAPAPDGRSATVELAGDPTRLHERQLTLTPLGGKAVTTTVSMHDALRRRAVVNLPADAPAAGYFLALDDPDHHPWTSWYFRPTEERPGSDAVAIVRPETDDGLLADRILTATLQAARADAPIRHLAPAALAAGLGETTALVIVGVPAPPAELLQWLRQQTGRDLRVLCLPTLAGGDAGAAPDWYPRWVPAQRLAGAALGAPHLGPVTPAWPEGLEELLLTAVDSLLFPVVAPPQVTAGEGSAVLLSNRDEPLLVLRPGAEGNWWWIAGFPLVLEEESIVFHPVFPLLMTRLLFPAVAAAATPGEVAVGQTVDAATWFAEPHATGTLRFPDQAEVPFQSQQGRGPTITVSQPGFYELRTAADRKLRAANWPRPPAGELTRADWERPRSTFRPRWLTPGDHLTAADFRALHGQLAGQATRRYDLSPVAAALVVLLLVLEGLAVWQAWRRAEA